MISFNFFTAIFSQITGKKLTVSPKHTIIPIKLQLSLSNIRKKSNRLKKLKIENRKSLTCFSVCYQSHRVHIDTHLTFTIYLGNH